MMQDDEPRTRGEIKDRGLIRRSYRPPLGDGESSGPECVAMIPLAC